MKTAPEIQDQIEPAEKIPAIFKPFVGKTPAQFLEKYIAREKLEAMAGFMAGFTDLGVAIPDWSKKASIQFWKNYVGDKPLEPFKSAEDFGIFAKLLELYTKGQFSESKPINPPSKLDKFLSGIAGRVYSLLMKKVVSDFSDAEKSQFYAGCVRAGKIVEKMQNPNYLDMIKRAKVYLIIAAAWRQVEKFKTHAERERWLRSLIEEKEPTFINEAKREIWLQTNEGKKFSAKRISSREFYDIFQIIELPGATPGRPKNPETRAVEIMES
jgi:hypothetical protein